MSWLLFFQIAILMFYGAALAVGFYGAVKGGKK